jgi:hypothetical protein
MSLKGIRMLQVLSKALAPVVHDYVASRVAPLETRIKELERMTDL